MTVQSVFEFGQGLRSFSSRARIFQEREGRQNPARVFFSEVSGRPKASKCLSFERPYRCPGSEKKRSHPLCELKAP